MRRPRISDIIGMVKSLNGLPSTKDFFASSIESSTDIGLAMAAAMMAPMLVPPTQSIGRPSSCIARCTPRWAKPRAAPPASTSPSALPETIRVTRLRSSGCLHAHERENRHSGRPASGPCPGSAGPTAAATGPATAGQWSNRRFPAVRVPMPGRGIACESPTSSTMSECRRAKCAQSVLPGLQW